MPKFRTKFDRLFCDVCPGRPRNEKRPAKPLILISDIRAKLKQYREQKALEQLGKA